MYIFVTRSIQIISLIIKSVSRDDKKLIWSSINKALLWTLGKSKEEMLIYIFWEKNVNICVYLDGIVTCIGHNKYRCLRKNSLLFSSLSLLHHRLFWVQIYTRNLWKHLLNRNKIWHISVRRCLFRQTCLMRLKSIFRPSLFVTLFRCNSISQINTYNLSNIILFEIANLPVLHGCYDGFLYKDSAAFSSLLLYVGNCEII